MPVTAFRSHSRSGQDVVLWRALRQTPPGRYVDVGSPDPNRHSISMAFYQRGWEGIALTDDPEVAERHALVRPRDVVVTAPGRQADGDFPDLAAIIDERGWHGDDIHFLSVEAGVRPATVLRSIGLTRYRPWFLVLAAGPSPGPGPDEEWDSLVEKAGYRPALFDGLFRFYVAEEHCDEALGTVSYPAGPSDDFMGWDLWSALERLEAAQSELVELRRQAAHWRSSASHRWADALARTASLDLTRQKLEEVTAEYTRMAALHHDRYYEAADLRAQLDLVLHSRLWRLTEPLRRGRRSISIRWPWPKR
ncbi:MAG: hypothetical protein KGQ66_14475 [Acidobacteriota bacterium]|nr:hypothetical protein [Acidobacteriota bacterium]